MGGLNDLLADEGLTCGHSQNLLAYLAGELLAYREEGVALAPDVVFCESIDGSISAMPGGIYYKIGEGALGAAIGKSILKDCASLAKHPWAIYIQRTDGQSLEYGVASFSYTPGSLSLTDAILLNPDIFTVLIRRVNDKTIRVVGSKGSVNTFLFSTSREEETDHLAVDKFASAASLDLDKGDDRDQFRDYLKSTVETLLRGSHGCIIACSTNLDQLEGVAELQDKIPLDPPLDIYAAFASFKTGNSGGDLANLQASFGLAQGLVQSDGMVVFDTQGRIVAFRAFYRPQDAQASAKVVGGARRRAYEGAKALVGVSLQAILFRSQDGLTLFHGQEP